MMRRLAGAVAVLCALGAQAVACSVPVFRYALDRWRADEFRLEVPASAPSPQRLLDSLGRDSFVNMRIVRDGDGATAKDARLFFPHRDESPAWTGKMDESALKRLVSSPAREEIAKRVLAGDSAVWVVVEGADAAAADEVQAALDRRLRYVEQAIALQAIDPNDPTSKLGPGPKLQVKFSTLRVKRGDPAEKEFLPILFGPRAEKVVGADVVLVPVFGRGRALGAWAAADMDDEQVTEACQFLCGACSCEVKAQNPGWDLLFNCDWDARLTEAGAPGEAILPPAPEAKPEPAEAVLVPIAPGAPVAVVEQPRGGIAGWVIVGAAVLAVGSGVVLLRRR